MNKLLTTLCVIVLLFLTSCGKNTGNGELTGAGQRGKWFEPKPYGMVLIPRGSFTVGPNDQDVAWALNATAKTVSVESYWMDETEITNNEYRQFVYWVRDSIARELLGQQFEEFLIAEDDNGNPIDPPFINWDERLEWDNEEYTEILEDMYLPVNERFFRNKEIDSRKLKYQYEWVDLQQAAKKSNRYNYETGEYEGMVDDYKGGRKKIEDRSSFIMKEALNIYPDTLCWIQDFTYSYNEPWTKQYFWHPGYDDYPVVGVSWKQASAFSIWRTRFHNSALKAEGDYPVQDYRLPTESEWEYAARGGIALNMYPWGGPYTRNDQGCFLANFKPLRGNYVDDGGLVTLPVGSYEPNEFGLYDMAGNVAEWTSGAYDESAYSFTHDMNPNYEYNALPDDPPALKRKVTRGGSWKDIGYYLQCATRTYEYQDTAKSYIGFRCVRTHLGK
ncbi:SUMF1/EgtB/PvdO family nonheme iron enzyme [Labilibaculum sp. A4]|uniref:Gliding motility-associated lipoprotein n=1 Tax=Labilibaculum manganireducens TaxID=1940525 RepID=A0A2N3I2Y7_9BACT|nr:MULTISPECIES: SUMF1/EgtB/PvdO family nonheme iron enzyme [Labilibaculum]MDQ1772408.1 SUMF1/EgtB/PvdO family nonheme iron enzyme [Labilibaculum euxinus]MWN78112.1 SUMF1/EgtB/PvdO family nonheme iron enzyme [Labilibaculum euxinus]PKQ64656.1 gliding motility-associated lipoprotein [Labilibaculum manganireducens]